MFLNVLFSLIISASSIVSGELFPPIEGSTLSDKHVSIPKDTKGKYSFIAVAGSRKAEESLNTWAEPLYYHFVPEARKNNQLFAMDYDVNLYFVPLFTGANKAFAGKARKQAIKHVDTRIHDYVLFFKGDKKIKQSLGMKNKNEPYFFLLNDKGEIVYQTSGVYTDDKIAKVEEILDELE